MTDVAALKALTEALHQQEHEPVEDMTGDPPNIVCEGDVEIAEGMIEHLERLGWRLTDTEIVEAAQGLVTMVRGARATDEDPEPWQRLYRALNATQEADHD